MTDTPNFNAFLAALALAFYFILGISSWNSSSENLGGASVVGQAGDFRFYDLLNFKTAFVLFSERKSPYVPNQQNELIYTQADEYPRPLNFLYPPFALVVFAPLLIFPWATLCLLWLGLSAIAAAKCGLLLAEDCTNSRWRLLFVFLSLTFAPVLSAFYWGQFSVFLTLFLVCGLRAYLQGHLPAAGFFLTLASCKPQFWFLGAVALGVDAIRTARKSLLVYGGVSLFALSLIAEGVVPGIHQSWLTSWQFVQTHADSTITPTLPKVLPFYLRNLGVAVGNVHGLTLISCSVLGFGALLYARPKWSCSFSVSLGLLCSVLLAPYVWFQDHVVLLLPLLWGLPGAVWSKGTLGYLGAVLIFSLLALVLGQTVLPAQHQMFWFPLGAMCLFLVKSRYFGTGISPFQQTSES